MSERIRLGSYYRNRDFVFAQDNGNPMSPDSVSNYCYKELSKKCGFKIHPHIFRHSQATILAYLGIDPVSISKRLGHAQVSTTMNIYAAAFRKGDKEVSNAIQNVLYKKA